MHKTAAMTQSININPAIEMAIAKLRCDTHSASSGFYKFRLRKFQSIENLKKQKIKSY